jgi:putative glutamine amidotransferase
MTNISKKPIIGIVGRPDITKDDEMIVGVGEAYRIAVIKKGGLPFIILPPQDIKYEENIPRDIAGLTDEEKKDLIRMINLCDGIIMPGGYKWYEYDIFICNYAIDNNIPLLGICMGMQLMGQVDNIKSNLVGDTNIKNDTIIDHNQKDVQYVHKVNISKGSFLYKILGKDVIEVNSRHNYHIKNVNFFNVVAYSEDNLIEAIELPSNNFALGVQWHPEKMIDYDENADKIFVEFMNKTKNK